MEGYTELGLIGFSDKGNYNQESTYNKNDLVHKGNKVYLSLQDNNKGKELPTNDTKENEYWKVWLEGNSGLLTFIEKQNTDKVIELTPNTEYKFPEMESLTITLGKAEDANVVNEYRFSFISGTTPTTLTLPSDVKSDMVVEANMEYEVSILNNRLVWTSWVVN